MNKAETHQRGFICDVRLKFFQDQMVEGQRNRMCTCTAVRSSCREAFSGEKRYLVNCMEAYGTL